MDAPEIEKSAVDARYTDGSYHERVFAGDEGIQQVLSKRRAQKLQPLVGATDSVFEFGVGTALNLRYLRCARRVGYDPGAVSAAKCREYGIEFANDLTALAGQTFDVVLCHHVLEHLQNPFETLQQLKQLLAPGGRLLLYVPFEHGKRFVPNEPNMHLFSWSAQTLGNLVERAGLRIESVGIANYGYEQRFAPLARWSWAFYALTLRLAWLLRPCEEVQLVAK